LAETAYNSAMQVAGRAAGCNVYEGIAADDLALLYQRHGDYALAERYYLVALSFLRKLNDRRMEHRVALNLASLYLEIGQPSKAENLLRPFIPEESHPSPADADDAVLLSDLASVSLSQHRLADAERLFQTVVDFLEKRHDPESDHIRANAMNNLAGVFVLSGRISKGAAISHRALQVFEALPPEYAGDLVKGLANLAMITARLGESFESEELYRRAIATSETELGPEHPLLGTILARYAVFLRGMRRNDEARKAQQRAKEIQLKSQHENILGYTVDVSALSKQ
jgi:tetratricopeptide (TPR) repeat protein